MVAIKSIAIAGTPATHSIFLPLVSARGSVYFEEIFLRCSQIQGFFMSVVKSYLLQQSMQLFCPAF
jgi:hypothetical protein